MTHIREQYHRFRQWQQQPFNYHDSHEHHGCCNCGAESENNYCPRCGQKAVYGPISWRSVWQGILDVWGVGTRSLPYTLWQLMEIVGVINRKEWHDHGWWHVLRRPALAMLALLLTSGICYWVGKDSSIIGFYRSYVYLFGS